MEQIWCFVGFGQFASSVGEIIVLRESLQVMPSVQLVLMAAIALSFFSILFHLFNFNVATV